MCRRCIPALSLRGMLGKLSEGTGQDFSLSWSVLPAAHFIAVDRVARSAK